MVLLGLSAFWIYFMLDACGCKCMWVLQFGDCRSCFVLFIAVCSDCLVCETCWLRCCLLRKHWCWKLHIYWLEITWFVVLHDCFAVFDSNCFTVICMRFVLLFYCYVVFWLGGFRFDCWLVRFGFGLLVLDVWVMLWMWVY